MRLLKILPAMIGAGLLFAMPAYARNYDCSKPGNANKTACKNAATAPAVAPAPAARHYDCSKAGNANKAVCKGAVATAPAAAPAPTAAPTPAPAPVSRPAIPHPSAPATTNPAGPAGATAMCNDGTYSHSAHRSGTCSRHRGVKTWY